MPDHDQPSCTIAHRKHLSYLDFGSYSLLLLASNLLGGLGDLTAGFLGLDHALDDTDSHGLKQSLV